MASAAAELCGSRFSIPTHMSIFYEFLHGRPACVRFSQEAEERLWGEMLERTKVNLTPGGAFHCVEPGWFRLCFAYQVAPGLRVRKALRLSFVFFNCVFFFPLAGGLDNRKKLFTHRASPAFNL